MAKSSVELEQLVQKIQKDLAPNADVLHNVKLMGRKSKVERQIDVLVRQQVGQYEMQIVIDCKDYKKPVDVKGVEEFSGLFEDVGAQKGVLVCPAGFSAAAKTRAEELQIDLYSPVDTDPHKWTARVTIPVVCDFRTAMISFGIATRTPGPFKLPGDFINETAVYDPRTGAKVSSVFATAIDKWNSGRFPVEVGRHDSLPIYDTLEVDMDNGYGGRAKADLYLSLLVESELFFGQLPITKITGFSDEIKGGIITNAFETGILNIDEVERSWQQIDKFENAPVRPVLVLRGLSCWAV